MITVKLLIFSLSLLLGCCIWNVLSCKSVDFGNGGTACVCDENYCDFIGPAKKPGGNGYVIYTSNLAGLRFNASYGKFIQDNGNSGSKKKHFKHLINKKKHEKRDYDNTILELNEDVTYQSIFGFGGAFTDSTGFNIKSLPLKLQTAIMISYFGMEGIEYNVGRVPIGGTDFSPYSYSYDDGPEDKNLTNFALKDLDYKYKIPFVKEAKILNDELELYGSAWTAPIWMKTNNSTVGGTIKPEMYQTWANYYVKFLEEYEKNNISFWGITTGNEPSLALFPLILANVNTVGWTPDQLAKWVSENYGPTLRNSKYKDIKLMAMDDQRYFLPGLYKVLDGPTNASSYIDGIAVHWYLDKYVPATTLNTTHYKYEDKFILSTEACEGSTRVDKGVRLGNWQRGENYAKDIIDDLNNWVIGWVDWNMAINMTGGPTYVENIVDAPIIVDGKSKVFYKNPMYYAMGHFSKFLPRGSRRISLTGDYTNLDIVAFKKPKGGIAIEILNRYNYSIPLKIRYKNNKLISLNVTPKSMNTVYW
nr:glucosylceramidase-like [Onthophagus taurus]